MVKARIILSLFFLFDLLVYFSSIWFGNYFTRSVFKFIPDIWSLSPLKAKSRTMGERQTYLLWQRFTTFQLNLFIIMSYRNIFFLENGDYFVRADWFPSRCRTFTRCWLAEKKVSASPRFQSSKTQKNCNLGAECSRGLFSITCVYLYLPVMSYILCRVIYNRHATFDNPVVYLKNKTNQTTTATKSQN